MFKMSLKKCFAAACFVIGVVLILVGGYHFWVTPLEHGMQGVIAIMVGIVLHAIGYKLWS